MNRKTTVILCLLVILALAGGGYYWWRHAGHEHGASSEQKAAQGKVEYTCPMHPFIVKDQPGVCPICNMELVKKVPGAAATDKEKAQLQQVAMSPTQQVIANVAMAPVTREPLTKEIQAVGIVAYDQARQAKVTAWTAGRIDRLYVVSVGQQVARGRPIAEVYSPDLVAAQQEYLLALRSRDQLKNSSVPAISRGGEGLVTSSRQRLKLLGVTDEQIAGLEKAGEPNIRLPVYTPISGVVIEKLVQEGQYVNVGDPLFAVADLSQVWVELEVYESDIASVRVGQGVKLESASWPGRSFSGRVAFIYPFLDPKTRTIKVRVELPNQGLVLKPDMFVNATLKVPLGETLTVPATALIDTGARQLVWVRVKEGVFEPRTVKIGQRVGERVQILQGLLRGDRVAASGGYLIDSEAQLSGQGGQPAATPAGHEGHGAPAPPSPQKKDPMSMDDMKM